MRLTMPSMRRVQEPLAQDKQRHSYSQGRREIGAVVQNRMLEPPLRRPDQEPLLNPMLDFVAASNGNASPNRGLLGYQWGAPRLTRVYNSVNCKYA